MMEEIKAMPTTYLLGVLIHARLSKTERNMITNELKKRGALL
jgi:hypothetical protein